MSEEQLLPCPFCGGEAILRGHQAPEYWVACHGMGCKASTEGFGTKSKAIDAWNTRATPNNTAASDLVKRALARIADAYAGFRSEHENMRVMIEACAGHYLGLPDAPHYEGGVDAAFKALCDEVERLRSIIPADNVAPLSEGYDIGS